MLELLFLGTGASVPSRNKSTSCIAVRNGSDIILMDCGEGSQKQIMISPFSFMKIRAILITHLHGDHVFGLPGLLQTMSLSGRKDPITIYGPPGIRRCVETFMEVTEGETVYPMEIIEVSGGESFNVKDMEVSVYKTEHNIVSVGFTIKEKDRPGKLDREKALALGIMDGPDMSRLKKGETVNGVTPEQVVGPVIKGASVSYTGDTKKSNFVVEGAKDVSALIHESTYMDSDSDLAIEHSHSTALQAAEVAKECHASCLILTHVSQRYDDLDIVVKEAKIVFGNTFAAKDMQMYEIRGKETTIKG